MKELAIIVPVYNEQTNIHKFISEWINVLSNDVFDLILINDGSTDSTADIVKSFNYTNLHIIDKKNEGHGPTILHGYFYAIKKNYDFIFQVDSDNQFSKEDFFKIWESRKQKYDIICGSRYNRNDPLIRVFLTKFILRPVLFVLFGKIIIDPNIPFRLMNREFLLDFIKKCNLNSLAPNILMSIYAKKILNFKTQHFMNTNSSSKWSFRKLLKFCSNLFFEILNFRFKL